MPSFSVNWNSTNNASATIPMGNLMTTASVQASIYEINAGSDATADNAVKYSISKTTVRGTNNSTYTPNDVNSAQNAVAASTFDKGWASVLPTVAANSEVLQWGMHQRGTYRWVAYDYTKMLTAGASAATKGLALMSVVVTTAFNGVFSIEYQE